MRAGIASVGRAEVEEGVSAAEDEPWEAEQEAAEEAEVHAGEEGVVAQVAELGDAAFIGMQIADRGGKIDDGNAFPGEADGHFGIEIEAAGEAGFGEGFEERGDGVEAHAEERVIDAPAEGFEVGPEVGDLAAFDAEGGSGGIEDRAAEDGGGGMGAEGGNEGGDGGGGVLAIGVHAEDVGVAEITCAVEAGEDGGAFAGVFREAEDLEAVGRGEGFDVVIGAVGGAIDDQEDVFGGFEGGGEGPAQEVPARIERRDEDNHARGGHGRAGFRVMGGACQTLIVIVPGGEGWQFARAMRARLTKSFHFEAAHTLPSLPDDHKCRQMHGHSFKLAITIEGEVDESIGWIYDHKRISDAMKPLLEMVDHAYLNDIEGLESPTIERMAAWFWRKLEPSLPGLAEITIHETPSASCTFRGDF